MRSPSRRWKRPSISTGPEGAIALPCDGCENHHAQLRASFRWRRNSFRLRALIFRLCRCRGTCAMSEAKAGQKPETTRSQEEIDDALMQRHGQTFCDKLSIPIEQGTPSPLFRWLVASLLF